MEDSSSFLYPDILYSLSNRNGGDRDALSRPCGNRKRSRHLEAPHKGTVRISLILLVDLEYATLRFLSMPGSFPDLESSAHPSARKSFLNETGPFQVGSWLRDI